MIVNWKRKNAGLKTIDIPNANGKTERTIFFLPGNNEISEDDWKKIKSNKQIQEEIKMGDIEEIYGVDESNKKTTSIKEMKAEDAIKIISETYDLKTLKKWRKQDSRDEVRSELKNRIEYINRGKEE